MMIRFIANMSCAQMSSSIAHVETSRTWPDLTGRVRFYAEGRRRIPSRCTFAASLVKYCCLKLHSHRGRNPLPSLLHPVICCSRCIWMVEEDDWTLTQRKATMQCQQKGMTTMMKKVGMMMITIVIMEKANFSKLVQQAQTVICKLITKQIHRGQ